MNAIFLLSVILKGIGAILEILVQVLVTRGIGVDGYGMYATWINSADLIFWICFSALTKCNTYYLSAPGTKIHQFKKRYYGVYVIPLVSAAAVAVCLFGKSQYCVILLITLLELRVLDKSSALLTQRHQIISLTGEYILGRSILVAGVLLLQALGTLSQTTLMLLYLIQYVGILLLFFIFQRKRKETRQDISSEVSLRKWGDYQRADLIQSMIGQMPVLLQFFFTGAFEAGVVSIVLTVKKMINFISGPSAKVFLPEFSRLYRSGKKDEIRDCFASIMRIQMLFVGPLSVVLVGYPHVILRVMAEELLPYTFLFVCCSMVFVFTATLGPCSGVLQMTGNEKKDNHCRELALLVMFVVMWLFRSDSLFVLYGLCAQAFLEAIGKYGYVCYWMKKSPVGVLTYLRWWIFPAVMIVLSYLLHLGDSFLWMILTAGVAFIFGVVCEWRKAGGFQEMLKGGL